MHPDIFGLIGDIQASTKSTQYQKTIAVAALSLIFTRDYAKVREKTSSLAEISILPFW